MNSHESAVSGRIPTPLEKEIDKSFSQNWAVYRIAVHPLGGLVLAAEMDWKYSTRQLLKMLELLDIHDALEKQRANKPKAEKNKPK